MAVDYTGAVVAAFTAELTAAMLAATGEPLAELEGAFTYDGPAPQVRGAAPHLDP